MPWDGPEHDGKGHDEDGDEERHPDRTASEEGADVGFADGHRPEGGRL